MTIQDKLKERARVIHLLKEANNKRSQLDKNNLKHIKEYNKLTNEIKFYTSYEKQLRPLQSETNFL